MPRLAPITEWRRHIGAHKTATTHLQDTLAAHRTALLAADVDYLPVSFSRPIVRKYARPNGWRRKLWSAPIAAQMRHALNQGRKGPQTVLLSEEDMLGYTFDLLHEPLYGRLPGLPLLQALERAGPRVKLFLALRGFDGMVASAYAQTLRSFPPEPGGFDAVRRRMTTRPPSWLPLVDRLRAECPQSDLTLWCYEDWRAHWRTILDLYVGRSVATYPDLPPPQITQSPSPYAIEQAETLDPTLSMADRQQAVQQIFAQFPAGEEFGRFSPLPDSEREQLRNRYAEDLAEIERRYPGMLFRPGRSDITSSINRE